MKVNIVLDISAEEARKVMGLPDIEQMQKDMIEKIRQKMDQSIDEMSDPELMMKRFLPIGAQGVEQFQKFMSGFAKAASDSSASGTKETPKK
jgi:hypothetical protein